MMSSESEEEQEELRGPSSSSDDDPTAAARRGVDVEPTGVSKFLNAAEEGNIATLMSLLDGDSMLLNMCDSDGYTALHRAAYSDQADAAAFLLNGGASVHARTHDGWTPLHSAARWNAHSPLKLLLQAGADINAVTRGGQTPLHVAADGPDRGNCLRILLLHPLIKTEQRNDGGDTALDLARRHGMDSYLFQLARSSINDF